MYLLQSAEYHSKAEGIISSRWWQAMAGGASNTSKPIIVGRSSQHPKHGGVSLGILATVVGVIWIGECRRVKALTPSGSRPLPYIATHVQHSKGARTFRVLSNGNGLSALPREVSPGTVACFIAPGVNSPVCATSSLFPLCL